MAFNPEINGLAVVENVKDNKGTALSKFLNLKAWYKIERSA